MYAWRLYSSAKVTGTQKATYLLPVGEIGGKTGGKMKVGKKNSLEPMDKKNNQEMERGK